MINFPKLFLISILIFSLNIFGQHNYEYIAPLPGSQQIKPEQTIILRPGPVLSDFVENQENLIIVEGSNSGLHKGELILSDDRRTLIFKPTSPFDYDEIISVQVKDGLICETLEVLPGISFSFNIECDFHNQINDDQLKYRNETQLHEISSTKSKNIQNKITEPKNESSHFRWDFPEITVLERDDPSSEYILLTLEYVGSDETNVHFLTILDNYGNPIYYKYLEPLFVNFQPQLDNTLTFFDYETIQFYQLNQQYSKVDSFSCGNGYFTNSHDIRLLENGHTLLLCSDAQPVQMDLIVEGGQPIALVTYSIIQELDNAKNVIFQWRGLDHIPITDVADFIDLTAFNIDFMHSNAIEIDTDGNFLLSSRHLSEITKIDRISGDIIWRFGGHGNQFEFLNDDRGFSAQHHIRITDIGNYYIFDNGNYIFPQYSRATEYNIDDVQMQATLIWEYNNNTDVFANGQGSAQRQVNGNTTIGWGVAPNIDVTEVRPDGSKALEIEFPTDYFSYRALRTDWETTLLEISPNDLYLECAPGDIIDTSLTITNTGNQILTFTDVNTYDESFTIFGDFPQELPPDGIATVTVNFQTEECGSFDNILTFITERSDEMIAKQISINVNVPCCLPGDVTEDGFVDILDIVAVVSHVLEFTILPANVIDCADLDGSSLIDILDIVILVEMIMDQN